MPDVLTPVPFSLDMLWRVQDFECGGAPWEKEVSDWIKGVPMRDDLRSCLENPARETRVWLYENRAGSVVGFSSLGVSTWPYPGLDDVTIRIGIVPNVAVASAFQGHPQGEGETKYACQIMDHIVAEAERSRYTHLGLFVHKKNERARRFYDKLGFVELPSRRGKYVRMIIALP